MDGTDPLRSFSLATFHTVSFVVAAAAFTHASDSLKEPLVRLDTRTGVVFFLTFWALTFVVTRAGLRKMTPIEAAPTSSIAFQTTIAGGWNGVGIFAIIVAFNVISGFASRGGAAAAFLPVQFFAVVIGSLLAYAVGAVVGLVYGLIDALLVGCGEMLYRVSSSSASA